MQNYKTYIDESGNTGDNLTARRHRDQGRRDCGNHARRLPDLGDGNRRRGDWA